MVEQLVVEQEAQELPTGRTVSLKMANLSFYGSGVFSNVYRGTLLRKEGNKEIAIKKTWPETRKKNFEVVFLSGEGRRPHKHCIQMLYSFRNQHKDKIMEAFVFDFMPDTLSSIIRKEEGGLDRTDITLYIWQLFNGLHYLSSLSIVHRDIKPINILIDHSEGLLKIGDFGSAKVITEEMPSTSYQVTRYYRPPELLLNANHYDAAVDVWSGGCCLGEMLRKRTLLPGRDAKHQLQLILYEMGIPTDADQRAMRVSANFEAEIKGKNFTKLCSKAAANWSEALALLQQILVYKPKERLSGLRLMKHPFFKCLFEHGAHRGNGQPISTIISADAIQLAEKHEQNHCIYKRPAEKRRSTLTVNRQQPSCSGSEVTVQKHRQLRSRTSMSHEMLRKDDQKKTRRFSALSKE